MQRDCSRFGCPGSRYQPCPARPASPPGSPEARPGPRRPRQVPPECGRQGPCAPSLRLGNHRGRARVGRGRLGTRVMAARAQEAEPSVGPDPQQPSTTPPAGVCPAPRPGPRLPGPAPERLGWRFRGADPRCKAESAPPPAGHSLATRKRPVGTAPPQCTSQGDTNRLLTPAASRNSCGGFSTGLAEGGGSVHRRLPRPRE